MKQTIKVAKAQGAHVQGTISYTLSPVHTLDDFVDLAKELEALECDSVSIKDMAGLITPAAAYELVTKLKEETDLLVDLHCHCTSGMTQISYYAACQAGVDILDTAISPLSGGTSQPPTESMVAALQGTPYDTGLDLKSLTAIKKYFDQIKEKYLALIDPIAESVDTDVLMYQIPGGMLSNLISQLKEQNALDRYNDVLDEMPRVRKDMGYPPLVTPTSQIVGIQAVMNVLGGERYKTVSNEVKEYMKGFYGKPPAPVNAKIAKKIIGDEEVITCSLQIYLKMNLTNIKQKGNKKVLSNLMKMHLLMHYIHLLLQNSLKVKQLKKNFKVQLFQVKMKLEFQLNIMLKLMGMYMKLKSCLLDSWKLKKLKKDRLLLLKEV